MASNISERHALEIKLRELSDTDQLTGLFNRQALESSFDRIWRVLGRPDHFVEQSDGRRSVPGENYWLAVIDIDHFKSINDRFGHMVGDEILLLVSRLMSHTFRGSDLLYRYGGEEFVAIIAPTTPRSPTTSSSACAWPSRRISSRRSST